MNFHQSGKRRMKAGETESGRERNQEGHPGGAYSRKV